MKIGIKLWLVSVFVTACVDREPPASQAAGPGDDGECSADIDCAQDEVCFGGRCLETPGRLPDPTLVIEPAPDTRLPSFGTIDDPLVPTRHARDAQPAALDATIVNPLTPRRPAP